MSKWRQYTLDNITINFLTFNVGNFNSEYNKDNSLATIVKEEINNLFVKDPRTIWIVTTQEDRQSSILINLIKSHLTSSKKFVAGGGYGNSNNSSYNRPMFEQQQEPPQMSQQQQQQQPSESQSQYNNSRARKRTMKLSSSNTPNPDNDTKTIKYVTLLDKSTSSNIMGFNVHLAIFVPSKLKSYFEIGRTMIEYHRSSSIVKTVAHTKASIVTHLKIKVGTYHNLLIVASHLPIDKSDHIKLGYKLRQNIISKMITHIIHKYYLAPLKYNNVSLMWLGDLNFRLDEFANADSDQFLNIMSKSATPPFDRFKLLDFTNIKSFNPTCKTKIKQDKRSDTCVSLYKATSLTGESADECYETTFSNEQGRIPSYCDRILGWNSRKNSYNLNAMDVKSLVDNFTPVFYSDHNAITGSLVLVRK